MYLIINLPNRVVVAAGLGFVSGGEIGAGVGAAALVDVSLGAVPFVL